MENFGIFTILSALAQMQAEKGGQQQENGGRAEGEQPPQAAAPPTAPPVQAGVFTAAERAARAEQILARHEAISRRIDRKNRKK